MRQASLCLLFLLSACARGGAPALGDSDQVRLDALVQATAGLSSAAICLDVDSRDIRGTTVGGDAFEQVQDPSGAFWVAASRMGHIYPQSRCSRGQSSQGLVPVHPEGSTRPGVFVTLGAVGLSADGARAHLQVITWPGELQSEIQLLRYRKVGAEWLLENRNRTMQE